jgi:hypothetical protein
VEADHPPGTFWRGPAAAKYYDALAGSFASQEEFINGIFDAIQPETAPESVLLQYWEYIRGSLDCIATPSDVEELRAAVVTLYRAPFSGTVEGLVAMITGFLPLVDVRDSLLTSALPGILPLVLEATGRVLEIWYPPLQVTEFQVDCVARRFMRDGDALRTVRPIADFFSSLPLAGDTLARWSHGTDTTLRVTRWDDDPETTGIIIQTEDVLTPSQHGSLDFATIFSVSANLPLLREFATVEVLKDFGAGLVIVTDRTTIELETTTMILLDSTTLASDSNSLILGSGGPGGKTLNGDVEMEYVIRGKIRPAINDANIVFRLRPRVAGVSVANGADFSMATVRVGNASQAESSEINFWGLTGSFGFTDVGADSDSFMEVDIRVAAASTLNGVTVHRGYRSRMWYHSDESDTNVISESRGTWSGVGNIDGFEIVSIPDSQPNGIRAKTQLSISTPLIKPTSP